MGDNAWHEAGRSRRCKYDPRSGIRTQGSKIVAASPAHRGLLFASLPVSLPSSLLSLLQCRLSCCPSQLGYPPLPARGSCCDRLRDDCPYALNDLR